MLGGDVNNKFLILVLAHKCKFSKCQFLTSFGKFSIFEGGEQILKQKEVPTIILTKGGQLIEWCTHHGIATP